MSWPKSSYRATISLWPKKCKPTSPPTSPPPKSKTPMATASAPECAPCSTSSPSTNPPPTSASHCEERSTRAKRTERNLIRHCEERTSLRGTKQSPIGKDLKCIENPLNSNHQKKEDQNSNYLILFLLLL